MSVAGHQPPPFFRRGPAPVVRLTFFVIVCLVLVAADLRFRYLDVVRQTVAVVTYPLQMAASAPGRAIGGLGDHFARMSSLQADNDRLRLRQTQVAGILLRQQQLEQENLRLRQLLGMRERHLARGEVAEILYAARDPFSRKVIIDKGAQQGISAGQAVVDDVGVIGQVTRVYPMLSEVTLITDKNQAVPVQVARTGMRSVLFGAGGGLLEVKFLATNADVRAGDVIVTSGLDGVFPPGLPVARVTRVEKDNGLPFARILCEPASGVENHGTVLVLGPREAPPARPEEADGRDAPSKGKKARRAKGDA